MFLTALRKDPNLELVRNKALSMRDDIAHAREEAEKKADAIKREIDKALSLTPLGGK